MSTATMHRHMQGKARLLLALLQSRFACPSRKGIGYLVLRPIAHFATTSSKRCSASAGSVMHQYGPRCHVVSCSILDCLPLRWILTPSLCHCAAMTPLPCRASPIPVRLLTAYTEPVPRGTNGVFAELRRLGRVLRHTPGFAGVSSHVLSSAQLSSGCDVRQDH